MITAYCGLPGAGKSYSAVANVIAPALKAGRAVYTNIPLVTAEIERRGWPGTVHPVSLADYGKGEALFSDIPGGALVVLDELWQAWPSGTRAAQVPDDHKEWLAQHRHRVGGPQNRAQEIVLVTQNLGQIAAFVRDLVERTAITRKLDALGSDKSAVTHIYRGAVRGDTGPKDRLIRTLNFRYSPDVYALYKSATQAEGDVSAGDESRSDKRGTIWRQPSFILGAVFALVVAPWAAVKAYGYLSDPAAMVGAKPEPEPEPQPQRQSSGAVQVASLSAPPPPAEPAAKPQPERTGPEISGRFRLVGVIYRENGEGMAMLMSSSGSQRIPLTACETNDVAQWECTYRGELVTEWSGGGNWRPGTAAPSRSSGNGAKASAASPGTVARPTSNLAGSR